MRDSARVLKEAGIRATHQRVEVYREVTRSDDHPDAETVYERVRKRVPTISLDTVYRTLWMLEEKGLISTLNQQKGRVRFDGNADPHHHFICTRCGMVADFENDEFDRLEVPEEVRRIGDVTMVQVLVRGLCPECGQNVRS